MKNFTRNIPDILVKIVETKKEEIKALLSHKVDMKVRCLDIPKAYSFLKALKPGENSRTIIAEVKKASPSAGIIAEDFNPVNIALDYERGGADCISVLTDVDYFKGHSDYLLRIAKNVKIPALRKDFIICEEQIYEARCLGASSFLLIAAILETSQLTEFIELGRSLGMEPLIEVHDEYELEKSIPANPKIIGVNNRNLRNFTVDTNTTVKLIPEIPEGIVIVGESGITSVEIAKKLYNAGCDSLLIGEFLMRSKDKSNLIKLIKE
jgi:indole-3-glycerol phosphate synthase